MSPSKAMLSSATSWVKPARSHRGPIPDLRRLYSRVMHRHGRAKAKVATARKLLVRLYIMRRDQIDYDQFRRRGRPPFLIARRGRRAHLTSGAVTPAGR
jgi:hypothetical protein